MRIHIVERKQHSKYDGRRLFIYRWRPHGRCSSSNHVPIKILFTLNFHCIWQTVAPITQANNEIEMREFITHRKTTLPATIEKKMIVKIDRWLGDESIWNINWTSVIVSKRKKKKKGWKVRECKSPGSIHNLHYMPVKELINCMRSFCSVPFVVFTSLGQWSSDKKVTSFSS